MKLLPKNLNKNSQDSDFKQTSNKIKDNIQFTMAIREFGREIQNKISLEPKIFLKKDVTQVIQPQVQVEDPITEYFKDIFSTWKGRISQPTHSYFQKQPDITDKMRGILIDWLIDIHLKYKLQHETLFLAVNVLDRYLEAKNILRDKLQLVGVTSMMIACKYEEIYPPNCKDFSQVTANTYTTQEIVMQEIDILSKLQFQITTTSVLKYLYKLIQDLKPNQEIVQIAHYFMDLSLLEINFQQYQPEQTANAALYLASWIWQNYTKNSNEMQQIQSNELLIQIVSELLESSKRKKQTCAVKRKYQQVVKIIDHVMDQKFNGL